MSTQLMYDTKNDTKVTATELAAVQPTRAMGRFHNPLPYGQFLELIKHRLVRAGIDILQEEYVTANEGGRFFGCMELGISGLQLDGMAITLGIRGSYDQTVPRGLCVGNQVLVCSNLCFDGDLAEVHTKQTTNIARRLPALIDQAVDSIPAAAVRQVERQEKYQNFTFKNPRHGDAALVELFRQGALSGTQLTRAVKEWDEPTYAEHASQGHSLWRLLNAVTEVQKGSGNPELVRQRTSTATRFLDTIVK